MISLDALVALDTIARKGSFAAAAQALGKVPSALSYQIRKLEEELDALLFDRRKRRLQLTPSGEVLLSQGRVLLESVENLQAMVRESASGWEQGLRITCDSALPIVRLHPLIRDFDRQQAPTRLVLQQETLSGSWESLLDERCDLLIGAIDDAPAQVHASGQISVRPLGAMDFAFCVAPSHPLASLAPNKPLEPDQLRPHRVVAVADSARHISPRSFGLLAGQPVLTVATMQHKLEAQVGGLGIGYLPRYLAASALRSGALIERRIAEPRPAPGMVYAWRRTRPGKALAWWLSRLQVAQVRKRLLQGEEMRP